MERTELTGRIVTPEDPDYQSAITNINTNKQKYPCMIVFCQQTEDILHALKWAMEKDIPFRIRGGRHSYENFSMVQDGLIIDLSEMASIQVNSHQMTATIDAGASLGDVYQQLWDHGVTIPAGTEASVGTAGLTLGGGIGLLTRMFGLTCDNLLEIEMIQVTKTKEPVIIKASETEHADLFWALRGGGGGNFGIVTALTYNVHAISTVSLFSMEWTWKDLIPVFDAWQRWAPFTDHRLTSTIELFSKEKDKIEILGEFNGPLTALKTLIRPLAKMNPLHAEGMEVPYIKAVDFFNDPAGNIPSQFKRSGSLIEEPLEKESILSMKKFLANTPNEEAGIWHQSLGGAVRRFAPENTAYFYRHAIIAQEYKTTWTDPDEKRANIRWTEQLRTELSKCMLGDYVNWPDTFIKNWPKTYYGDNYPRLQQVKATYDPHNVFQFAQSISLTNKGTG